MALTQREVSELYVSIFGRASEGAGNKNWQQSVDAKSAAENMLNDPAAKEYFGESLVDDAAFVEHIYANTLNKAGATVDAAGKAGWVQFLEAGNSRAEMVVEMIKAIKDYQVGGSKYDDADQTTKDAAQQFVNRVDVSNYVADNIENVPANGDLSVFQAYNNNTTHNVATKDAQIKKVDNDVAADGGTGMLTKSLATLDAANTAKSDWLKSLDKIDADLDSSTDAVKADDTSIKNYYDKTVDSSTGLESETGLTDFGKKSVTLQDAAVAEKLSDYESEVTKAKKKAADGMTKLLETVTAKEEAVVEKSNAIITTFKSLTGKVGELKALVDSGKDFTLGTVNVASTVLTMDNIKDDITKENKLTVNDEVVAKVAANGALVLTEAPSDATAAEKKALSDAQKLAADFIAAYNTNNTALNALKTAVNSLKDAVEDVVVAENDVYSVINKDALITTNTKLGDGKTKDQGVTADLTVTGIKYFETKLKADVKQAITYTISTDVGDKDVIAITVNGNNYSVTAAIPATHATPAAVYAALEDKIEADENIKVTIGKDVSGKTTITLTAEEAGTEFTIGSALAVTNDDTVTGVVAATPAETKLDIKTEGDAIAPLADTLKDKIEDLADYQKLVAAFEDARDLKAKLDALTKAVTDAEDAITNATDDKDAPGLGLNLVTVTDKNVDATSESDVIILNLDEDFNSFKIENFGEDGLDQLFVGSGYNFVKLGSKEKIEDYHGDVSKLEIFYKQDGSDVKLYIENETFAGNSKGTDDMVTVILAGVNVDDLTFGTFISAGEIA